MAYRKTRLTLSHQGLAINADIRTKKLDPEQLEAQPDIIRRDQQTGQLVIRQIYDKATEEPLEEGYGFRYVNEDGDEVPKEDVEEFVIEDGEERAFSKHEPTLGGDRTVEAITWIPVAEIDEYLVDRVYELWGEDDTDVVQLHELAVHIRDFEEAPVIPVVLKSANYKDWGIITPIFFEETFSLIIRVTSQKIEPDHRMEYLDESALEERETEGEAPTLEQQSPFS
jgi:hypothetical protein